MNKVQGFSFALGLAFGLVVLGCMVAASDPGNANTGWRYEYILPSDINLNFQTDPPSSRSAAFAVFDRETGTVSAHNNVAELVIVLQFQAQ